MHIKHNLIIFFIFACVLGVYGTSYAYITPGQFLGEEPTSSDVPTVIDDPIPSLIEKESVNGVHDDVRAGIMQQNFTNRPKVIQTDQLPSNKNRKLRIPDRPVAEKPLPDIQPVQRIIYRRATPLVDSSFHQVAPVPPTGLPLWVSVVSGLFGTTFVYFLLKRRLCLSRLHSS